MDSERFDGLVRSFGQTRSRRQTLRGLAGVAAGASALALSGGTRAQEASPAASPEAAASAVSPMGTEIAWLPVGRSVGGIGERARVAGGDGDLRPERTGDPQLCRVCQ